MDQACVVMWRPYEPSREAELAAMQARDAHPETCLCGGAGWLWGYELRGGEPYPTDTRYTCDREEEEDYEG